MISETTKFRRNTLFLGMVTSLGLSLTLYALFVEIKLQRNANYKPMCDINEGISCTTAFTSRYALGFGLFASGSPLNIPNPIYGITYYTTQLIICGFAGSHKFINFTFLLFTTFANFLSLYLVYVLYKLHTLCVVCVALYAVNLITLIVSVQRWKYITKLKTD